MNVPWRKNTNLIEDLYNQLQEISGEVKLLKDKDALSENMTNLQDAIAQDVFKRLTDEKIISGIVLNVLREMKKKGIGLV